MRDIFEVGFGLALFCAAITAAIFVARAFLSDQLFLFGSERIGKVTWLSKVHIGAVILGWCATIFFGVKGLLFWLPQSWGEAVASLAGLVAIGSVSLLMHFEQLPRMRRQLAVRSAVSNWWQGQLRFTNMPSNADLERLANESTDSTKTPVEREIAEKIHYWASALKERDERFESHIVQKLQREQQQSELRRQADEKQADELRRAAELDRALKRLVAQLPVRSDPMAIEEGAEAIVQHELIMVSWSAFKKSVVSAMPSSATGVGAAQQNLKANLAKWPGVKLPTGGDIEIAFSGHERDGYCDAFVVSAGERKPFSEALHYDTSLLGLLAAFFLGAAFRAQSSWGHGCYDRDYSLVVTEAQLRALLVGIQLPADGGTTWPPPGIRVRRLVNTYIVSCLSTRPGRGLFDLGVEVSQGCASPLLVREVYVWGEGTYY